MADFKSLLSKRVDDAERPAILPVGTYEGVVVDYQPIESNTADRTPQVRVNIRITAASDGIEAADLVDAKGKPIRVADRRMRHDFWLDEENQWKLSEFIRSCGVETADPGQTEAERRWLADHLQQHCPAHWPGGSRGLTAP